MTLSTFSILAAFVVLGKPTLLQIRRAAISEECCMNMIYICFSSLTTRFGTISGHKLGNTMAIINAEYHTFHSFASKGDKKEGLGFPGTWSHSKREDFKGQPLLWPGSPLELSQ